MRNILDKEISLQQREQEMFLMYMTIPYVYICLYLYENKACKHIVLKNIFRYKNQSVTIQTIAITTCKLFF